MTLLNPSKKYGAGFKMCRFNGFILSSILLSCIFFNTGCNTSKQLGSRPVKSLEQLWDSLDLEQAYHVGFVIKNVNKRKPLFEYRGDNLFTPASNIKLLTLYTALNFLEETIPAAYYTIRKDTLLVWGGGDPGTKYPSINEPSPLVDFLTNTDKPVVFSNQHFQTGRFGDGWMWDDYPYYFQTEKTAFPIYGNKLWIERFRDSIVITPFYFNVVTSIRKDTLQRLSRNEWGTSYNYRYDHRKPYSLSSIPLSLYENDIRFIWKGATGKDIFFKEVAFMKNATPVGGSSRDTMLKWMMQESDNFIAEQLLLACALKHSGLMNENLFISEIQKSPLFQMPDSIAWVDGSGLSRYNLMTPGSTVWLLEKILEQKGIGYIKSVFPAGGVSGTLSDSFGGSEEPFIFAKTGSMRNVYCLSGFLFTKSGDVLSFSWMNNHFQKDTQSLKNAMQRLLHYVRDHY